MAVKVSPPGSISLPPLGAPPSADLCEIDVREAAHSMRACSSLRPVPKLPVCNYVRTGTYMLIHWQTSPVIAENGEVVQDNFRAVTTLLRSAQPSGSRSYQTLLSQPISLAWI